MNPSLSSQPSQQQQQQQQSSPFYDALRANSQLHKSRAEGQEASLKVYRCAYTCCTC